MSTPDLKWIGGFSPTEKLALLKIEQLPWEEVNFSVVQPKLELIIKELKMKYPKLTIALDEKPIFEVLKSVLETEKIDIAVDEALSAHIDSGYVITDSTQTGLKLLKSGISVICNSYFSENGRGSLRANHQGDELIGIAAREDIDQNLFVCTPSPRRERGYAKRCRLNQ